MKNSSRSPLDENTVANDGGSVNLQTIAEVRLELRREFLLPVA